MDKYEYIVRLGVLYYMCGERGKSMWSTHREDAHRYPRRGSALVIVCLLGGKIEQY